MYRSLSSVFGCLSPAGKDKEEIRQSIRTTIVLYTKKKKEIIVSQSLSISEVALKSIERISTFRVWLARVLPAFTLNIWTPPLLIVLVLTLEQFILLPSDVFQNCWMGGKECRSWSDATFCGVWSGPTLFAQAVCLKYLGSIRYSCHESH